MTTAFLSAMTALGLMGFDPIIALVGMASLLAGASVRNVRIFLLTTLVATPLLAILLSRTVARPLAAVDWDHLLRSGPIPAAVEGALALGLAAYAVRLWRRGPKGEGAAKEPRGLGLGAQLRMAALLVAAWLADPFFLAVPLATADKGWLPTVFAAVWWTVLSQVVSIVLLVGMWVYPPTRLAEAMSGWWARQALLRFRLLIGLCLGLAVILAVDAGWFAATQRYLIHL